jgi:catechol 2,3-dioxygenase-like lactoylglutathione lyase family enzyme
LGVALGAAALYLVAAPTSEAVAAEAAAPVVQVLAPGNFIHVVAHLDRTIAFYHEVLGLELAYSPGGPSQGGVKFAENAPVAQLYAVPPATPVGVQVLRLPERAVALEFAEFRGLDQKSSTPNPQDPGASVLVLTVRSLDPVLARVRAAKIPIVSTGGMPVVISDSAGKSRAVVVKDPDGFYIELLERDPAPQSEAAGPQSQAGNVLQAGLMLAVADMARTLHLYRDLLGLQLQTEDGFAPDAALSRALGVSPSAQVRHSIGTVPGSDFKYDFVEWKAVKRKPAQVRIFDRGAGVLRVVVGNVDAAVRELKADGVPVVSTGGGPVVLNAVFHASILRDPNGLFFEPVPLLRPRPRPQQQPQHRGSA